MGGKGKKGRQIQRGSGKEASGGRREEMPVGHKKGNLEKKQQKYLYAGDTPGSIQRQASSKKGDAGKSLTSGGFTGTLEPPKGGISKSRGKKQGGR